MSEDRTRTVRRQFLADQETYIRHRGVVDEARGIAGPACREIGALLEIIDLLREGIDVQNA